MCSQADRLVAGLTVRDRGHGLSVFRAVLFLFGAVGIVSVFDERAYRPWDFSGALGSVCCWNGLFGVEVLDFVGSGSGFEGRVGLCISSEFPGLLDEPVAVLSRKFGESVLFHQMVRASVFLSRGRP